MPSKHEECGQLEPDIHYRGDVLPTFDELRNAAPPEYIDGNSFRYPDGTRGILTVTARNAGAVMQS